MNTEKLRIQKYPDVCGRDLSPLEKLAKHVRRAFIPPLQPGGDLSALRKHLRREEPGRETTAKSPARMTGIFC